MAKRIIATVGMCGSGKSVVADYLERLGFYKVYFGGITLAEIKRRGLELNETNERMVREELRRIYGMAAFAILSLPTIEKGLQQGKRVLIDGLYSFSEYKALKDHFGEELLIIAVFTERLLRYKRLAARPVRPLTPEQALTRDISEIENLEKGGPIALADYTLLNNGLKTELFDQLKAVLIKEEISLPVDFENIDLGVEDG